MLGGKANKYFGKLAGIFSIVRNGCDCISYIVSRSAGLSTIN